MANQNRAKYYYEPMRTQSKNKQTATGAKKTKHEYSGCEWLITFHEIG